MMKALPALFMLFAGSFANVEAALAVRSVVPPGPENPGFPQPPDWLVVSGWINISYTYGDSPSSIPPLVLGSGSNSFTSVGFILDTPTWIEIEASNMPAGSHLFSLMRENSLLQIFSARSDGSSDLAGMLLEPGGYRIDTVTLIGISSGQEVDPISLSPSVVIRFSEIPEPSSLVMIGGAALGSLRRRRGAC